MNKQTKKTAIAILVGFLTTILLITLLLILSSESRAATRPLVVVSFDPLTLRELCTGYLVSKRGNDTLIRCPGDDFETAPPWFLRKGCMLPIVDRSVPGQVTIRCTFYDLST